MRHFSLKAVTVTLMFIGLISSQSYAQIQQEVPQFRSDIVRLAPTGVLADTINVWGAVTQRGRFMVPRGTTVTQMLSYTGGPGIGAGTSRGGDRNIFGYYTRPQVEVYLHRYDEYEQRETLDRWVYRLRDPFPEGMRNYPLRNGEYITVFVRTRPTALQYVLFGITTLGSLAGGYFLVERLFID